jgi:hypothetical protein
MANETHDRARVSAFDGTSTGLLNVKIDRRSFFSYDCFMIHSVQTLIPIAIHIAQGVRVVVRVIGIKHRG